jgi:hypothetical protein
VQADSVSDSDSESRNKNEEIIPVNRLTQTVCTDPPAPATATRICTVKQDILRADWRRLSESESEPESACTIRVHFKSAYQADNFPNRYVCALIFAVRYA